MVIPEREISIAQQSLNMDEMQGLSFETAGEALQGTDCRFGHRL